MFIETRLWKMNAISIQTGLLLTLLCLTGVCGQPPGNDLEEFEKAFRRMSSYFSGGKDDAGFIKASEFDMEFAQFSNLGRRVQKRVTESGFKDIDIPKYVFQLHDAYKDVRDKRDRGGKATNAVRTFSGGGASDATNKLLAEIDKVKSLNLYASKTVAAAIGETASVAAPPQDEPPKPSKEYSKAELFKKLQDLRDRLVKSDMKVGGMEESTISEYLNTLTEPQKKTFGNLVDKYVKSGFEKEDARGTALRELNGRVKNDPSQYTKEDLVKMLLKLKVIEKN